MGKIKQKNANLLNNKLKSSNQKNKNQNLNKIKNYSSKREFRTLTTSLNKGITKSISRENNFKNKTNLTLNDSLFSKQNSISPRRNIKTNLSIINRKNNNFLNKSTRDLEGNSHRSEYEKSSSNLIQIYNRNKDKNLTFNRMEIQILSNNDEKNNKISNLKSQFVNKLNNKYILRVSSNLNSLEDNMDNDKNINNEFDKINKDDSFVLLPKDKKKKDSFHL